jgi:hypothetical protein
MSTNQERFRSFFVGFYSWIAAVFFGAVLLDIVYSNSLSEASVAFSEGSDFLLLIGFVTILSAVGAVILSWNSSTARYYFMASSGILLFEFLIPVFFSQLIPDTQGSGWMTDLRILINGMASILAWVGLYRFYRRG